VLSRKKEGEKRGRAPPGDCGRGMRSTALEKTKKRRIKEKRRYRELKEIWNRFIAQQERGPLASETSCLWQRGRSPVKILFGEREVYGGGRFIDGRTTEWGDDVLEFVKRQFGLLSLITALPTF